MNADPEAREPAGPAPHTPGAASARLRELWGERYPQITDATRAQVDQLIGSTGHPWRSRQASQGERRGDTAAA
jgi:hypothetical protein